jgi:flagellar hook-associated protein 3 FlgL
MRITHKMMTTSVAANLIKQKEQLYKIQQQVSSQKRLSRLSDDPVGMGRAIDYRRALASIDQNRQNSMLAKNRIAYRETVLDEAVDILNDIKHISETQGTGDLDSRNSAIMQVEKLRDQLAQLANTQLSGRYLFAGDQIDTKPFSMGGEFQVTGGVAPPLNYGLAADATDVTIDILDASGTVVRSLTIGDGVTPGSGGSAGTNSVVWDGLDNGGMPVPDGTYRYSIQQAQDAGTAVGTYATYHGDSGQNRYMVGGSLEVNINADGSDIFADLFYHIERMLHGMHDPDGNAGAATIRAEIDPLEQDIENIRGVRSEGGIQHNWMELLEKQWQNLEQDLESMRQGVEGINVEEAIVMLKSQETAYQTALQVAARVTQPSLVDFMK